MSMLLPEHLWLWLLYNVICSGPLLASIYILSSDRHQSVCGPVFPVALRNTAIAFKSITEKTETEQENYEFYIEATWRTSREHEYISRDETQRTAIHIHQATSCDVPKDNPSQSQQSGSGFSHGETIFLYLQNGECSDLCIRRVGNLSDLPWR